MADDGKRTMSFTVKVTERVALDLLRVSTDYDRSISDYLYGLIRMELYGQIGRIEHHKQITLSDKVAP